MSSPVGHSLAGYVFYCFKVKNMSPAKDRFLFFATLLAANIPDFDFLPGLIVGQPNRYHHGISHSIGAAIAVSFLLALGINFRKKYSMIKNFLLFLIVYCSHLLLDFFSMDSRPPAGIPVFWPLSSQYMIFSNPILPPVRHSHLDDATIAQVLADLFSLHNLYVIFLECCIIMPVLIIVFRIVQKGNGINEGT